MLKPYTINIKHLTNRLRAATSVFRYGYPRQYPQKASPLIWPDFRNEQPQWHAVDIQGYVEEGFNLNSLIYSAVMYKARASIIAPLRAYTGDPQKPELLPVDHPLAKLVARPNPHQSWPEFQGQNIVYENLAGNVYIYMDRDRNGDVIAMYSLRPDRVFIIPGKQRINGVLQSTILGYLYVPEGRSKWLEWDKAEQRRALNEGLAFPIVAQDMMHVKLPNPGDPLEGMGYGMSPVSPGAQSADVDNSVTRFLKLFFDRGVMLTGVLQFDVPIEDNTLSRIRHRWREIYGGFENWDIGVLDQGAKYQRVGLTFEEMGFDGIDERNESRILGPFGVPPILIGTRVGLQRSTFSNAKEAREAFWEDTFLPENGLFERDYQYYLQTADGGFVAFDYSNVPALAPGRKDRVDALKEGYNLGAVLKSEYRAALGLTVQDADNVYSVPIGRMELPAGRTSIAPTTDTTPPADDNRGAVEAETDERTLPDDKALPEPLQRKEFTPEQKQRLAKQIDDVAVSWEEKYGQIVDDLFEQDKREVLAIVNGVKKKSHQLKQTPDYDEMLTEINAYLADYSGPRWVAQFKPLTQGVFKDQAELWFKVIAPVGVDLTQNWYENQFAQQWFQDYEIQFAQPIGETTNKEIQMLLLQAEEEGWSVDTAMNRLGLMFDQWMTGDLTPDDFSWFSERMPAYRREAIIRTESIKAANASSNAIFADWGVQQREWISENSPRTRPTHRQANGQVVGINEPFQVGNSALMFPGDPTGPPEEIINCRCSIIPRLQ